MICSKANTFHVYRIIHQTRIHTSGWYKTYFAQKSYLYGSTFVLNSTIFNIVTYRLACEHKNSNAGYMQYRSITVSLAISFARTKRFPPRICVFFLLSKNFYRCHPRSIAVKSALGISGTSSWYQKAVVKLISRRLKDTVKMDLTLLGKVISNFVS